MIVNVYYDPATGTIDGYDTCADAIAREGLDVITVEVTKIPDRKMEKVVGSEIVPMTTQEQLELNKPARWEVDGAVARELAATDKLVLPDRDDISAEDRAAWVAYRKALRDLSKGSPAPSVVEMMQAWPLAPTGDDAIADLRSRMEGN